MLGIGHPLKNDLMRSLWMCLFWPLAPAAAKSATPDDPDACPPLASLAASTAEIVFPRKRSLTTDLRSVPVPSLIVKGLLEEELGPLSTVRLLPLLLSLLLLLSLWGVSPGSNESSTPAVSWRDLASPSLFLMPPFGAHGFPRHPGNGSCPAPWAHTRLKQDGQLGLN